MKKYRVIGLIGASADLGVYEAEDEEGAIEKAMDSDKGRYCPTLCHQCAREIEISDIYEYEAYKEN